MDWENPPGQRYSKILSEVKTSNPSGQKHFKIVSEVKTSMNRLSRSSGQNILKYILSSKQATLLDNKKDLWKDFLYPITAEYP